MYKKLASILMTLALMLSVTAIPAMAASWDADDVITISIRVFDTAKNNSYAVGTDTVTKGDQYIRSNPYKIRPLSDFTANAGAVQKVAGNWYFPTSDQQPGATVYFSCNSDTATITYWAAGYSESTGTGSAQSLTENLGGYGTKTLNYTIVYHSNFPDGKDYKVSVKYTVKSYIASRNMFSSAFKTYSACSFGGFKPLENEKTWYTDASCKTPSGTTLYAANGGTYQLYAGWASTAEAAKPVTLTCYDSGSVVSQRSVMSGESVTLSVPEPAKENADFSGWASAETAEEPAYKENEAIALSEDTTLYAVWSLKAPAEKPAEEAPAPTELVYTQPYEIDNNYAYLFGLGNSVIGADNHILRGEASAIIYRLLKQDGKLGGFSYDASAAPSFKKLENCWYRSAIEFMTYLGVYTANPDITIGGDSAITRGEAFKVFAVAMGCTEDLTLTAEQYAQILAKLGYVNGDADGATDYRVADSMTRAEFCKVYNAIIGRDSSEYKLFLADGATPVTAETYGFTDMAPDFWGYEIMLKATSSFDDNGYVNLELRGMRNALDDYSAAE